ncbi:MAG: CRISPR system precrRNA processing endoribonuclease RAMP protein Cas6 [Thermofilum sp.]
MGASVTVVRLLLKAVSGGGLPWFVGHECRAGFLRMVSELDSELAVQLHEGGGGAGGRRRAVFSLRPLSFLSGFELVYPDRAFSRFPVDGNVVFGPGARAAMSVSILREDLAGRFVVLLLPRVHELKLEVKGCLFEVEQFEIEVLDARSLVERGELFEELDVRFETPTYFNPLRGSARYKVLYPDPAHLMASLVATAHQLTGASYPKPEELAEQVYVSGLDIKTPYVREVRHQAPTGFVGWVKLKAREEACGDARRVIAGLLRLGEVTNVGGNRSGGYGVVKVEASRAGDQRKRKAARRTGVAAQPAEQRAESG